MSINTRVLFFIVAAALAWGVYVPVVHEAASRLGSNLRAFLMVGTAYFLTAVLVPCLFIFVLKNDPTVKDPSQLNFGISNMGWGLAAGLAGAIGALCVIFAVKSAGPGAAIYVAPLVFAGAPIINTIASMTVFSQEKTESPSALFFVGLLLAAAGAAMVMLFKPGTVKAQPVNPTVQAAESAVDATEDSK